MIYAYDHQIVARWDNQMPNQATTTHLSKISFPVDQTIVHELELGLVIGKKGRNIKRQDYLEYIGGYFLL